MKQQREKCLVLLSNNIFTAVNKEVKSGFVVIEGNKIVAVGSKEEAKPWIEKSTKVIDLVDKVVTPGFVDCHTFFTGYVLKSIGIDFAQIKSDIDGIKKIQEYRQNRPENAPVFGHAWEPESFKITEEDLLDKSFPNIPIVIFTLDRDNCWMNEAAKQRYGFTPEACYAEKIWRIMPEYLNEADMKERYLDYVRMLNEKGITTIKEMSFDDYYGFADVMETLEKEDILNTRVSLMSQPVGRGIDIEHGKAMKKRFKGEFINFSGFNRMTDRGIPSFLGELIEPYASRPDIKCLVPVEWDLITKETLEADKNGFRYSLHCQGDGAVRHTVELFDRCEKVNGKLKNRHAITDLEYTNPADLEYFGKIGGITEVYAQIQSLDKKQDVMDMIERQLGKERGKNYWNRRKMWDSGICVTCGTDLPLLIPDIPEAIYCGCGGYFSDGESFNQNSMLTIEEMLIAWTKNGQFNCYNEHRLGTLEVGKLADIAVLDGNVFKATMEEIKNMKVCLTISDGRIVYDQL